MSQETNPEPTQVLREALVRFLTDIIAAPDDEEIARNAAGTLRELDVRLAAEQSRGTGHG
ncbi:MULTISPECIES: armadillo/beta-catenin-like repeat-containing protein [Streptomyces]|uniref:armadillo/beta-catenin-like repeat-containing protein n=1 Tax=Streptomyces TaxID=1883 RepID=UPI000F79A94E|nr:MULTISPECIES: armadillo/beta-catenin-like repeat-containing protein [Streptomyces]RST06961.1 hypothetical protein EF910_08250 [Streptomyces sp. WAC07149]GLX17151.1 hypothetical protein Slala01_07950 [Streptomyces lavendulae subsp. lavendulae]GLX29659.1 hypothetical protein Slala02_54790 [Streptomyces lavendulae subsp. lavendulae]